MNKLYLLLLLLVTFNVQSQFFFDPNISDKNLKASTNSESYEKLINSTTIVICKETDDTAYLAKESAKFWKLSKKIKFITFSEFDTKKFPLEEYSFITLNREEYEVDLKKRINTSLQLVTYEKGKKIVFSDYYMYAPTHNLNYIIDNAYDLSKTFRHLYNITVLRNYSTIQYINFLQQTNNYLLQKKRINYNHSIVNLETLKNLTNQTIYILDNNFITCKKINLEESDELNLTSTNNLKIKHKIISNQELDSISKVNNDIYYLTANRKYYEIFHSLIHAKSGEIIYTEKYSDVIIKPKYFENLEKLIYK